MPALAAAQVFVTAHHQKHAKQHLKERHLAPQMVQVALHVVAPDAQDHLTWLGTVDLVGPGSVELVGSGTVDLGPNACQVSHWSTQLKV